MAQWIQRMEKRGGGGGGGTLDIEDGGREGGGYGTVVHWYSGWREDGIAFWIQKLRGGVSGGGGR